VSGEIIRSIKATHLEDIIIILTREFVKIRRYVRKKKTLPSDGSIGYQVFVVSHDHCSYY